MGTYFSYDVLKQTESTVYKVRATLMVDTTVVFSSFIVAWWRKFIWKLDRVNINTVLPSIQIHIAKLSSGVVILKGNSYADKMAYQY